jgi:alpha-mannosidase
VIENGPVRATVRTEQEFFNSKIIRDYSLTSGANHIDVKVKIDFREKHRILKFSLPVNTEKALAVCKIPFGTIERATDGSEQVSGDWIALVGEDCGITVATDSKHSFDADGNVLSLTVLRSAIFADHYAGRDGTRDEFCEFMEQGEHSFRYRISPFVSLADAQRHAEELQYTPFAIQETFHKGSLPTQYSGIKVSESNVTVTAIKEHRGGCGTVVRLYENEGRDTDVKIALFGQEFECHIPHDSIKTFLFNGTVSEIDFLE